MPSRHTKLFQVVSETKKHNMDKFVAIIENVCTKKYIHYNSGQYYSPDFKIWPNNLFLKFAEMTNPWVRLCGLCSVTNMHVHVYCMCMCMCMCIADINILILVAKITLKATETEKCFSFTKSPVWSSNTT